MIKYCLCIWLFMYVQICVGQTVSSRRPAPTTTPSGDDSGGGSSNLFLVTAIAGGSVVLFALSGLIFAVVMIRRARNRRLIEAGLEPVSTGFNLKIQSPFSKLMDNGDLAKNEWNEIVKKHGGAPDKRKKKDAFYQPDTAASDENLAAVPNQFLNPLASHEMEQNGTTRNSTNNYQENSSGNTNMNGSAGAYDGNYGQTEDAQQSQANQYSNQGNDQYQPDNQEYPEMTADPDMPPQPVARPVEPVSAHKFMESKKPEQNNEFSGNSTGPVDNVTGSGGNEEQNVPDQIQEYQPEPLQADGQDYQQDQAYADPNYGYDQQQQGYDEQQYYDQQQQQQQQYGEEGAPVDQNYGYQGDQSDQGQVQDIPYVGSGEPDANYYDAPDQNLNPDLRYDPNAYTISKVKKPAAQEDANNYGQDPASYGENQNYDEAQQGDKGQQLQPQEDYNNNAPIPDQQAAGIPQTIQEAEEAQNNESSLPKFRPNLVNEIDGKVVYETVQDQAILNNAADSDDLRTLAKFQPQSAQNTNARYGSNPVSWNRVPGADPSSAVGPGPAWDGQLTHGSYGHNSHPQSMASTDQRFPPGQRASPKPDYYDAAPYSNDYNMGAPNYNQGPGYRPGVHPQSNGPNYPVNNQGGYGPMPQTAGPPNGYNGNEYDNYNQNNFYNNQQNYGPNYQNYGPPRPGPAPYGNQPRPMVINARPQPVNVAGPMRPLNVVAVNPRPFTSSRPPFNGPRPGGLPPGTFRTPQYLARPPNDMYGGAPGPYGPAPPRGYGSPYTPGPPPPQQHQQYNNNYLSRQPSMGNSYPRPAPRPTVARPAQANMSTLIDEVIDAGPSYSAYNAGQAVASRDNLRSSKPIGVEASTLIEEASVQPPRFTQDARSATGGYYDSDLNQAMDFLDPK
jgi:hypothetical protein